MTRIAGIVFFAALAGCTTPQPKIPEGTVNHDIVVTRIIDAPLERVWQAWTQCELVMRWWGPKNFTSPTCKTDFREGGGFVWHMRGPKEMNNADFYTSGTYTKILVLQRIEFTQGLSDKDGNRIDPTSIGMPPDFPADMPTTLSFRNIGNKTELVVTESGWTAPGQMRDMSELGLHETLDKLVGFVEHRVASR